MTLTEEDSTFVRALARSHAALVFEESKEYLIEARLTPVALQVGAENIAGLVTILRRSQHSTVHDLVIDALTINETSWFRDRHPFDAMREHLLPRLIEARKDLRSLTVWCGAASTGQEPYSLAILIREHFPEISGWTVRIVATDICKSALEQAREGLYSQIEINRGLPAALISRYFQRDGTRFRLDGRIREMIEFKEMNLAGMWTGVPRADLVLMRNVMIYFDQVVKSKILNQIAATVLRPDGALLLGGAETTLNLSDAYERIQKGSCGWYQLKGGKP